MNRVLASAGLALAFHAGLFWWGRDWALQPSSPPESRPGMLEIELTAMPGPSAPAKVNRTMGPAAAPESALRQTREKGPSEEKPVPTTAPTEQERVLPAPDPEAAEPPRQQPAETAPAMPAGDQHTASAELPPDGSSSGQQEGGGKTNAAGSLDKGEIAARPLYRINPPPPYPPAARQRNYEGIVLLEVLVNEKGRVGDLRVARSSGHALLDQAALDGVRQWRFEPGRRGREKIAMWVQVPIRFVLD